MTYPTKNDRKHGTRTHRDVDAAAIDWASIQDKELRRQLDKAAKALLELSVVWA
jgi:hypothetical protein